MKAVCAIILACLLATPVLAQGDPDVLPPPTGDVTITAIMVPCIVHVLLDGTVTLASDVRRSQVTVEPENGALVQVVGGVE